MDPNLSSAVRPVLYTQQARRWLFLRCFVGELPVRRDPPVWLLLTALQPFGIVRTSLRCFLLDDPFWWQRNHLAITAALTSTDGHGNLLHVVPGRSGNCFANRMSFIDDRIGGFHGQSLGSSNVVQIVDGW